jgi:hypothetical protein
MVQWYNPLKYDDEIVFFAVLELLDELTGEEAESLILSNRFSNIERRMLYVKLADVRLRELSGLIATVAVAGIILNCLELSGLTNQPAPKDQGD